MELLYVSLSLMALFAVAAFSWVEYQKSIAYKDSQNLENQKYEFEKRKWDDQKRYLEQGCGCNSISVGKAIADHLTGNIEWLESALRRTEFLPFANSRFSERTSHYSDEKERIADVFSEILIDNVSDIQKDGKTECILLIDSGTSTLPFFKKISSQVTDRASRSGITNINIITSNFAGAVRIMRSDDQVDPPVQCIIVAGSLSGDYAAIIGKEAIDSLRTLVNQRKIQTEKEGKKCHIIALVSGNWVRLRHTKPRIALPMVRGKDHLELKQVYMELADQVYVIAPLGKIFVSNEKDDKKSINDILMAGANKKITQRPPYDEVDTGDKDARVLASKIKLVTSARCAPKYIMHAHSVAVGMTCGLNQMTAITSGDKIDLTDSRITGIFIRYDYDGDREVQIKLEFPHAYTHSKQMMDRFQV